MVEEKVEKRYYLDQRSPGGIVAPYLGFRIFYKPSLGKVVHRAAGVMRRSKKVIRINEKVAGAPPAPKCKGLPWKEFTKCLRKEMKTLLRK